MYTKKVIQQQLYKVCGQERNNQSRERVKLDKLLKKSWNQLITFSVAGCLLKTKSNIFNVPTELAQLKKYSLTVAAIVILIV